MKHKVDGFAEFTVDCSGESVKLSETFASSLRKDGLIVRLVNSDPNNMEQQIGLSALIAALRVGESSKHYASDPVKGLADTLKEVKTNLGLQNNSAESGLPSF